MLPYTARKVAAAVHVLAVGAIIVGLWTLPRGIVGVVDGIALWFIARRLAAPANWLDETRPRPY